MKRIIALAAFAWAHRGVEVKEYAKGDRIETDDDDLLKVAIDEGWAKLDGKNAPQESPIVPPATGEAAGGESAAQSVTGEQPAGEEAQSATTGTSETTQTPAAVTLLKAKPAPAAAKKTAKAGKRK